MNKRIKKKIEKSLKNRLRTKSLTVHNGDIILLQSNMTDYNPNEMYDMFCTVSNFFKKYGCDILFMHNEFDISKLDDKTVEVLEDAIKIYKENKNG